MRGERPLNLLVELVGVCHLCNAAYRHLCRKPECLPYRLVHQFVNSKLPEGFCFPRHLTDVITGSIRRCKRACQRISLFGCGEQFQLYAEFHTMSISRWRCLRKYVLKQAQAWAFLPPLKQVGFPP